MLPEGGMPRQDGMVPATADQSKQSTAASRKGTDMEFDDLIKGIRGRSIQAKQTDSDDPSRIVAAPPIAKLPVPPPAEPFAADKTAAKVASSQAFEQLKQRVHGLLVQKIDPEHLKKLPEDRQRLEVRRVVEQIIEAENQPLSLQQKKVLTEEVLDDALGFGPLEKMLRDQSISDILINGANSVYVERNGLLHEEDIHFRDDGQLLEIIQRIVSRVGRRIDTLSPMVDARLPDGSRFNAIIPPLALNGPMVSIRRFGKRPLRIVDLLALKAFTPEMCKYMEAAVKARLNILVSGGTGSGKTTLLNTLSSFIPADERIVTIEDAAELQLQQKHVGRLETRPANVEGEGKVTIRDLVSNALRMRPDRIVIGECRGAEALDMLQAMNTGHDGSLTTLHANTPRDALGRLETMIMLAGLDLPNRAMRQQIASAINVILQVERLPGGSRRVTKITEVVGMEEDVITLQDLFVFKQLGIDAARRSFGQFLATGLASHFESRFRARGFSLPPDLFRERVLLEG
jgi:pilus assembly protein CpaF